MNRPPPHGLATPGELVLLARDAVWIAAVRRAVSRLAPRHRPLICQTTLVDPKLVAATLAVVEIEAKPLEALAHVADLRQAAPDRVIIALLPRGEEAADAVFPPDAWQRWLTTAGASAVVESPCESDKLERLIARALGSRPESGGELPVAWHML